MAAADAVKAVRLFKIGGFQKNDQPINLNSNKNQVNYNQFQNLRRERSMPRMATQKYTTSAERSYDLTDDDFIDESFESSGERNSRNYQSNTTRSTNNLSSINNSSNRRNQTIEENNLQDSKDRNERFKNEPYARNDSLIKEYNKDIQKTKTKSETVDVYERTHDPTKSSEKLQLTPRNKDGKLFKIRYAQ